MNKIPKIIILGGLCLGLTAATVSLATGALTESGDDFAQKELSPDAGEIAPDETAECREARLSSVCQTIVVGEAVYRYALFEGSERGMILLDPGGPGSSVLNSHAPVGVLEVLPDELRESTIVVIEEPWVTTVLGDECKSTLSSYYDYVRNGHNADDMPSLDQNCDIDDWAWDSNEYTDVLEAIMKLHEVQSIGFIGLSFGSARFDYLETEIIDWAILAHPAPPSQTAIEFRDTRLSAWDATVGSNICVFGCVSTTLNNSLSELSAKVNVESKMVAGRSMAVTSFDVGFAALAAAYLSTEELSEYTDMFNSDTADLELIGSLSDVIWNRYGAMDISPAYLSYLGEVCDYYDNWEDLEHSNGLLEASFYVYHLPCAERSSQLASSESSSNFDRLCLSGSSEDAVVGLRSIEEWQIKFPSSHTIVNSVPGHSGEQALADCLEYALREFVGD